MGGVNAGVMLKIIALLGRAAGLSQRELLK